MMRPNNGGWTIVSDKKNKKTKQVQLINKIIPLWEIWGGGPWAFESAAWPLWI